MRLECPNGWQWLKWNEHPKQWDRILATNSRRWVLVQPGQFSFKGRDFIVPIIRKIKKARAK